MNGTYIYDKVIMIVYFCEKIRGLGFIINNFGSGSWKPSTDGSRSMKLDNYGSNPIRNTGIPCAFVSSFGSLSTNQFYFFCIFRLECVFADLDPPGSETFNL